eukprot:COSAG06_NODE_29567_length_554_cov_0.857143_2_plen_142_part_01
MCAVSLLRGLHDVLNAVESVYRPLGVDWLLMIMSVDQWNVQATVMRINESLIERGYVTWFDMTNMKGNTSALATALLLHSFAAMQQIGLKTPIGGNAGSTMDAMSEAIEGADVMLYGVSLAYKESANVSGISNLRAFGILYP